MAAHCSGDDYEMHFIPEAYLDYYRQVEGPFITKFVMETLHKIYSSGKLKGNRLLEIGCGPCLHMVIPAANWFKEIVLSDFSATNLQMQQNWLNGESNAHNWGPFFKYYSSLEGTGLEVGCMELELKRKIRQVLHCNILNDNPLDPVNIGGADVICSSLCLEAACLDISSYNNAVKNIVSLLKPKGTFLLVGLIDNEFYRVGDKTFSCLSLTKLNVLDAFKLAGLEIEQCFDSDSAIDDDTCKYNKAFVIVAKKT